MGCKSQLSPRHPSGKRAELGQAFQSCLEKARPEAAVKAIQAISLSSRDSSSHAGATLPGRPQTSPRKGDTPQDSVGAPDTKHINYPAALGLGELPSKSDWARAPGHPNLWNEDSDSLARSVLVPSSPGGGGRLTPWALREGSGSSGRLAAELGLKATAPWVPVG